MLCVVTIVDSISPTSMPVNEFVIYRCKHNFDIKQILITCNSFIPQDVLFPGGISIKIATTKKEMRAILKEIVNLCNSNNDEYVFHLHHQKSAILFYKSSHGLNLSKKVLFTIHSTYSGRDLKYKLSSIYCALKANYSNCVSKSAYLGYSKIIKSIKKEHFCYIRNGVDVERLDSIADSTTSESKNLLLCVGRMIPLKNHIFLLHLMRKLPERFKLLLIGKEDENKKIRTKVKELNLDSRVTFLGLLSRDEVYSHLSCARYYVSPSFVEGFPISVLEATEKGLIPVLSSIGPHDEISKECPHINCLPLDVDVWAKRIMEIDGCNDDEVLKMQASISNAIKTKFSLATMHEQYLNLYQKIIG